MLVKFEGKEYQFDLDEITLAQATVIKVHCKLTLIGLEAGLRDGDPDALRAIYWLMLVNSGSPANIDTLDFKIVKFANAVQEASNAEDVKPVDPTEPVVAAELT